MVKKLHNLGWKRATVLALLLTIVITLLSVLLFEQLYPDVFRPLVKMLVVDIQVGDQHGMDLHLFIFKHVLYRLWPDYYNKQVADIVEQLIREGKK